jgi:hypothetical protein
VVLILSVNATLSTTERRAAQPRLGEAGATEPTSEEFMRPASYASQISAAGQRSVERDGFSAGRLAVAKDRAQRRLKK